MGGGVGGQKLWAGERGRVSSLPGNPHVGRQGSQKLYLYGFSEGRTPWRGEKREKVNTAGPFDLKVLDTARECWYPGQDIDIRKRTSGARSRTLSRGMG